MEQQEVKDDVITPESNPIAYTLSVTTPDEVVAVVNNPEIKPHARPTYELTRNVFFVGFMVAGKTSTSRRLARQCGLVTIDLDAYIERRERRAINQIFAAPSINIAAQYLQTSPQMGYVVIDIEAEEDVAQQALQAMKAIPGTIRARLLF